MNLKTSHVLFSVGIMLLGILFSTMMKNAVSRQYFVVICVLFIITPSMLFGFMNIKTFNFFKNNLTDNCEKNGATGKGCGWVIYRILLCANMVFVGNAPSLPISSLSNISTVTLCIATLWVIPFCTRVFGESFYLGKYFEVIGMGITRESMNAPEVLKHFKMLRDDPTRECLQILILSFFLSSLCLIWFLIKSNMFQFAAARELVIAIFIFLSMSILTLINYMNITP